MSAGGVAPSGLERFPYPILLSRRRRMLGALAGSVTALLAVTAAAQRIMVGDAIVAPAAFSVFGVFSLFGFGAMLTPRPRGGFRYLNAVVLTRAEEPPADSWVHLAPVRPPNVLYRIAFGWASVAAAAGTVYGVLQIVGAMPRMNTDAGIGGLMIAVIAMAVIAVVCGWVCGLMVAQRVRTGTAGRRPAGITLGESGVADFAWEDIAAVDAVLITVARDAEIPTIRLLLSRGAAGDREQRIPVASIDVPTDALYTALRWYAAHPGSRRELSHVEGRQRLDGWRNEARRRDRAPHR